MEGKRGPDRLEIWIVENIEGMNIRRELRFGWKETLIPPMGLKNVEKLFGK